LISAVSFSTRSVRPPLENCSIESRRCLTSDETTCRTSASSRSCDFSMSLFMMAALSIRSAERRAVFLLFIAAVMSPLTLSRKSICARLMILIRIAVGDVPLRGFIVETLRHLHGVDLHAHFERGLHREVSVAPQRAAERAVHRVGAHLVRILGARRSIDPAQQR